MSKILVAYFSQSGNTARAAEAVARAVGAKTYEIEPSEKYPADYNKCIAEAKREKEADARPALKSSPAEAVKEADIVFLGYPIWWYDAPMFYFTNPHALYGPGAAIPRPVSCRALDFELEVGVVLGSGGSSLSVAETMLRWRIWLPTAQMTTSGFSGCQRHSLPPNGVIGSGCNVTASKKIIEGGK